MESRTAIQSSGAPARGLRDDDFLLIASDSWLTWASVVSARIDSFCSHSPIAVPARSRTGTGSFEDTAILKKVKQRGIGPGIGFGGWIARCEDRAQMRDRRGNYAALTGQAVK
jgi:hypothetical protein